MDKKRLKVYIASSVGTDYFFFLGKTIATTGCDVRPLYLITEQEYRALAKSSGFKKIWLRIKMYILYPMYLIYHGFKSERGSIFVISSNTFFAPALIKTLFGWRRLKVAHMLYDLFPDALEIAGAIRTKSIFSNLIGKITKLSQRSCNATIYLGDFLKIHAERRWGKSIFSAVIDISTDLELYDELVSDQELFDKVIIHYGGQLGHLHDAASIIAAVNYICKSDIADKVEFNFYVSGAQANLLREALKGTPAKVISAKTSSQWRQDIKSFHVGLVSLSPGGASVCLPSKTYGMMAGGLAIVAFCPKWSDLATLVTDLDAGYIINNSVFSNKKDLAQDYLEKIVARRDTTLIVEDFYRIIKKLVDDRDMLHEKKKNAHTGVREKFNIVSLGKKWEFILDNIV